VHRELNYKASRFHNTEANFAKPLFKLNHSQKETIFNTLKALYGAELATKYLPEFERIISVYYAYKSQEMLTWEDSQKERDIFTEQDIILITYGDLIKSDRKKPLETLADICEKYFQNVFNTIHLLPFFPYSSDRGFAIIDFRQLDPNLGRWDDINRIHNNFKLMFDGVFNHISSQSFWFQEFLNGNPDYQDFFTVFHEEDEISHEELNKLMRPRNSHVLSEFETYNGSKLIWTTFSPDQIDLKFQNPKVLLKMTEILLYYVRRGADLVRLDAVTYLWDEIGTTGAHLWQTHAIIKLFRYIIDIVAPRVILVTETNVPHSDNISYFGNGKNEAHMVYNFALPPLILHTFYTENVKQINKWAKSLSNISDTVTFLNFFDSHDGIGLQGVKGILTDNEIDNLIKTSVKHGGLVSYKSENGKSNTPYELNITSYSALNGDNSEDPVETQIDRYLAARAIPLILIGVPGIYLHGLLGSKNDINAIKNGDENRSINRNILHETELIHALEDKQSTTYNVSKGFSDLIYIRKNEAAFHPHADQIILDLHEEIFSVLRTSKNNEKILSLINVSNIAHNLEINICNIIPDTNSLFELVERIEIEAENNSLKISLRPYQICWLKVK
jgi:sucrose phosphorylase